MTVKTKVAKSTKKQLERRILELKAQMASAYHFVGAYLTMAEKSQVMGSGVLLQLTGIGGRELVPPVMLQDGLSEATITALLADLARSYELATLFKPVVEKTK